MKKLLCILLCVLGCAALCSASAEEEITIVHVTDMHYLSPALTDYGDDFMEMVRTSDGKVTHYTPQLIKAFVNDMLQLRPDAVILSGDLTFNGADQSHADLIKLLLPLGEAGIEVLALSGNHDTNAAGYKFEGNLVRFVDSMADEAFDSAYAQLGYDRAVSRDSVSQSYIVQLSPRVRCLLLDVNANGTAGTVSEETFLWLDEQLRQAQAENITVIAVSHQPALIHNSLFTFGYVMNNNTRLVEMYEKYQVPLNLCGHLHMQHIAKSGALVEIAGSSLAVAPNQYGVIRLQGGRLVDYCTQTVDVAAWAVRTGQTDENLQQFAAYSANFFDQTTVGQVETMLAESAASPDQQAQMSDFAVGLNAEYFSGKRTLTEDHPAWKLWETHMPASFFTYYMRSILSEAPQDMTQYTFSQAAQ